MKKETCSMFGLALLEGNDNDSDELVINTNDAH